MLNLSLLVVVSFVSVVAVYYEAIFNILLPFAFLGVVFMGGFIAYNSVDIFGLQSFAVFACMVFGTLGFLASWKAKSGEIE